MRKSAVLACLLSAIPGFGLMAGAALADLEIVAAGRQVSIEEGEPGVAQLKVDGAVLLEDGMILIQPQPFAVGGVTVVAGIAGAGGNACAPSPFVLALPEGAAPQLYGPVDSCREFSVQAQPDALVFASDPLPSEPGEVWIWTPAGGLTPGAQEDFAAGTAGGWEAVPGLSGAHPVDAMKLAPVLATLEAGLGADYPAFAERISELGSGDLTREGYLGQACLKFTCEADWALLYLYPATEGVFAAWAATGDDSPHLWPADTALWPAEALAALRGAMGKG